MRFTQFYRKERSEDTKNVSEYLKLAFCLAFIQSVLLARCRFLLRCEGHGNSYTTQITLYTVQYNAKCKYMCAHIRTITK